MRQKFLIIPALIFLAVLLVGLNAASYTQKEELPDTEIAPNRSTYHAGATGTHAFYDLLAETGRKPTRWQEPMSALLSNSKNIPSTFVVIGQTQREFTDKEIEQLLSWVSQGGKLVIIDRKPPSELVKTTANWSISFEPSKDLPFINIDPNDQNQMTENAFAAKPIQPSVFTEKINAVQMSRFASSIKFERFADAVSNAKKAKTIAPPPIKATPQENESNATSSETNDSVTVETNAMTAPVVHLANNDKNLLVDVPFGSGKIVFLSDPYIVSNGGINLVDNAQIAINVVASREGIIAFDEFHQGYGANNNSLLSYFEGTPLTAMILQLAVLIGVILYTQSRRFARPLPENEPNRLSKLEYVWAMAELQQRTKAYDLAIENIYTDFRRRAARLVGVDNFTTSRQDLAKLLAERAETSFDEVENLMFISEDIIRGEPTNKREVLQITSRLRQLEEKLGLQRGKRK